MPRRRARRQEPVEEEEEHVQEEVQEDHDPEPEQEPEPEPEPQRGGDGDGSDGAQEMRSLQFDEELSWRPAKPIPSATLVARLERLSKELADFEQQEVQLDSLKGVAASLAHRNLLQHKDRGVKAYTACCLVELLRLFAPEAPFTDDQLKMMFALFVKDILPALHDPTNPYNSQHKYVLMSLTDVKSILILPDLHGADDLLLRLFNSTFDGVSASSKAAAEEQVAKDVEIHLTDMLMELIDESPGSVPATVIDAIISQFLRAAPPGGGRSKEQSDKQSTLLHKTEPAAYVMAKNICNGCADKMSRYVSQYFSDVILNASGFATKANGYRQGEDSDDEEANAGPSEADLKSLRQAHLLIRELWRAAPTILQNVVPQLDAELSADNVHLRLIATEAVGDMISGIGAAGPPPPPVLDPTAYPPLRLVEESSPEPVEANVLTKPYSPQSFAQTHAGTYRNFVGRKNDKIGTIRAAWVTAAGYILSTSAGGIGLSREEESELVKGLVEKLNDSEEKVRLAAVKAIELFDFPDVIIKLGATGGVDKEGSIFASLADRCRDRKPAVRVDAMVLLGKLWAVGAGEIAEGQEAVAACLSGVPSRIINAFYANDPDLNILLDRVMFECLVPLKYPLIKGKAAKSASQASHGKGGAGPTDQDRIRAERILLMLKALDTPAQKAFFAMQARQPQFAKGVGIFIQQCEAYNGGLIEANEEKVKESLAKTFQWLGASFPDPVRVRSDLQRFAKLNDRRSYQLVKYAIESESDFKTVRRAINELITKIQAGAASGCLDTLIPLLYRSSCLMFNRSHLATIMDYSKSDKDGLAGVAHQVLNDISQRNPDIFKAHAEELRKEIIEQAPTDKRTNDPAVVDILKAYSSYAKRYPGDIDYDRSFTQTLMNYALYASPPKSAKYAVNILLAKNDDKSKVTATNLLRTVMKGLSYGSPHFLAKLATISQLERLVPTVTADSDDTIHELTIKKILRDVHTHASGASDPEWVDDADMDQELQAKCLSLKILVNQALANEEEADAEERVKPVFKLLKAFVINEGEFCKTKDTPLHHKRRLRLLAGLLTLKLCTVKKYDEQFDAASFNKLAELVQDTELQVRRRFMEKLQNYLTRAKLRARFHTILFLVAFEPVTDLKNRVETWIRSRARYYSDKKQQILEAIMGRLIPLLAHHPDFTADTDDLADFANYFLFYLGAIGNEENISLIYKYAERVKQTRDGINPDVSDNLYALSDLAQAVIRKFQERRNWSFQAWPGKVGLPTGLYTALPSSEIAQQIAKKQYIPDELDERLDDLLRAMDRKKKRKSVSEWNEPPAKRAKTQIKTVIRERSEPKPKAAKAGAKKVSKPKAASRPKKQAAASSVPASERRRSGRAHKVSDYKERDDAADEEEMLDGVAEWEYDNDGDSSEADRDPQASDDASDEEAAADDDEDDEGSAEEDEEPAPSGRNGQKASAAKARTKTAVSKKATQTRGRRGAKDEFEMDVEDDNE
ncbi:Sister chromatid cohesion protein pds5 [Tolypocladium paradoxum]|uniref:Sister chromatid cohesion protein pds5 n=1 Tax=Tolypocladium paradoxum TaxID=94208 RepID=A0A2S4L680_9HYPO|nr:Sister chromatid cohesion protein pds5 [Tolypocladium paradoxum]